MGRNVSNLARNLETVSSGALFEQDSLNEKDVTHAKELLICAQSRTSRSRIARWHRLERRNLKRFRCGKRERGRERERASVGYTETRESNDRDDRRQMSVAGFYFHYFKCESMFTSRQYYSV